MPFIFSLLVVALMIVALIDIITRDDSRVRFLPKMVWLIVVILLPLIGSILWFTLGREYDEASIRMPRASRADRGTRARRVFIEEEPSRAFDTRSTEQQMADLDREIEEWRLRQELEKRRDERGESGTA